MKAGFFVIAFFLSISTVVAQKEYISYLNVGVPLYTDINWKGNNFTADLGLKKKLNDRFATGIGVSYLSLDLKPSCTVLTFDRKLYNFFIEGTANYAISDHADLIPGIRFGYAIVNYTLNEFNSDPKGTNGFSITPEIIVSHSLGKRISIVSGVWVNAVFTELEINDEIVIPQSYVKSDDKMILHPSLQIGISYLL